MTPDNDQETHAHLAIAHAQAFFPRGLMQPPESFRFAADALLLASFVHVIPDAHHLLDLGCGCGVVAFALQLRHPKLHATGLDIQTALLDAATANAYTLGLQKRFTAVAADICNPEHPAKIPSAHFDIVTANPPYRPFGSGRLPASNSRRIALFDSPGMLQFFTNYASHALRPDGRFILLFPFSRRHEALAAFAHAGLTLQRYRYICSRAGTTPALCLLDTCKLTTPYPTNFDDAHEETTLVLHEGTGANTQFTDDALTFCPHLACNASRSGAF